MNSTVRTVTRSLARSAVTVLVLALLVIALFVGVWIGRAPIRAAEREAEQAAASTPGEEPVQEYTCSMHPQIRLRDPKAKCPICFMDLIPVVEGEGGGERTLVMSEAAMKLAEVQTAPVVRRFPTGEVRMSGRIGVDETRTATIAARYPGRVERLLVNYTGARIEQGQPVAEIYSPELLSAQAELRQTAASLRSAEHASPLVRQSTQAVVEAAREKLRLLGLTEQQIQEIARAERPLERLMVHAPIGGVVVRREAVEGEYLETGAPIYAIADLSRVWVQLEAFESQLPRLRYGQEVSFTSPAFPGGTFRGRIAFIDPTLSPETRTVRLRVNADNPDGRLRPGMFVHAVVRSRLAGEGQVISDELAGRWISPLHPEVISDSPGTCPASGLPLVPAEELGYVSALEAVNPPLVIPASAALITGRRAVVYVRDAAAEKPTFEGREVVLGARAGDWYIVASGLREGERVVVNGAFKIDSAMQLAAKPSMMSIEGEARPGRDGELVDATEEFLFSLKPVYAGYLEAQEGLADDDLNRFKEGAADMHSALRRVRTQGMVGEPLGLWRRIDARLRTRAEHIDHLEEIEDARKLFELYSRAILELAGTFGHPGTEPYFRAYCPMAFDDTGAEWLQRGEQINNPYFGELMLRCGEIRARFDARNPREGER